MFQSRFEPRRDGGTCHESIETVVQNVHLDDPGIAEMKKPGAPPVPYRNGPTPTLPSVIRDRL